MTVNFRKIFRRLEQEMRNADYEVRARVSKILPRVDNDVPFVCQFASPEHAELSLMKQLKPRDDLDWRESGATSPERYADWAFTMCGMASTAMVLRSFFDASPLPAELAEDALKHGVYQETAGEISDMRYREYATWITKYNLRAKVYTRLSIHGIKHALSNGRLVMISVNPNIRGVVTAAVNQRGGHLVLVTGYDTNAGTITINNPSGFASQGSQLHHTLAVKVFKKYFAGRGIVLIRNDS
ncbi:TPA: hypothetical protein DEP96_02635 [Candidatus Uhrbacteria bacterium]|nr:hypothetical protein [Candidatus Uhrbacteria bacterium]